MLEYMSTRQDKDNALHYKKDTHQGMKKEIYIIETKKDLTIVTHNSSSENQSNIDHQLICFPLQSAAYWIHNKNNNNTNAQKMTYSTSYIIHHI